MTDDSTRHRHWRRGAVSLLMGPLLSGCLLTTESDISIESDGSGTAIQTFLYDDDMARLVGPAAQFEREVLDARAAGAEIEILEPEDLDAPYTNGLRYRADFADASELETVLTDGIFDTATVTLDEGVLLIEAVLEQDEDMAEQGMDLPGIVTARVTIEVEGEVLEANSTTSSGSTHTWRFDATDGGVLRMEARLDAGFPVLYVAAGVIALLVLGGWAVSRRRRNGGGPVDEHSTSGGQVETGLGTAD